MNHNGNVSHAQMPSIVNPHLDSIQHNPDTDGLLLSASSLTYRYWNGSLWYFENPDSAPDIEKCTAGVEISTGVSDAKWIQNDLIIAGTDAGSVMFWKLEDDMKKFSHFATSEEHDDLVTSVSVNSSKEFAVSASQDYRVKIWNIKEGVCCRTLKGHFGSVKNAAYSPQEPEVFVSCSQDGKVILWDLRQQKPARAIETPILMGGLPTYVAWHPEKTQSIAIGTESGHVFLKDIRTATEDQIALQPHSRGINRIVFSNQRPNYMATASEDASAAVIDFSSETDKIIYKSTCHTDFVRGLSWNKSNKLYTCAWDFKIIAHDITHCLGKSPSKVQGSPTETMDTTSALS